MTLQVDLDDVYADDVRALLATHLSFSRGVTPPEYSFALDGEQLADPSVTFFSVREGGRLLAIAALKHLDESHAEVKSMHTAWADRGRGVGRALVEHIVGFAQEHGYRRLSLETGTTAEFRAARALYARAGFVPCDAFGSYRPSPYNTFMTLILEAETGEPDD